MKQVKRSEGLPPNFDELPAAMQRIIEEEQYRRQRKWSHGYCPGDPCLTSMSASGVPLSVSFGARVDKDVNEEAL